eukprot:2612420-Pleurochrysis_carterae.AAC.1
MQQICADAHAPERLFCVPARECLNPLLLSIVTQRTSLSNSAATSKMFNDLLEHGAKGFACIATSTRRVAEVNDLARHDEAEHVKHPSSKLRVQLVDIR